MTMTLIDDGTFDTVYRCDECGAEERYSQEWRAGFLLHEDACAGVEDEDDAECTCDPDCDYDSMQEEAESEHECEPSEGAWTTTAGGRCST